MIQYQRALVTQLGRILLVFCFFAVCCTGFGKKSPSDPTSDHLEPPEDRIEEQYQQLLERRLFQTPADFGRLIVLPSRASEGETSVAIYSGSESASKVAITCTKAATNLYYAAFSGDSTSANPRSISITRVDASFPAATANAVHAAIERALTDTRPRVKSNAIILHGTDIQFSIENQKSKAKRGLLTPYSNGAKAKALRRLVRLLESYCAERGSENIKLIKDIEATARTLVK